MCGNDGRQAISIKERASRLVGEKVRDAAQVIILKALWPLLLSKVLHEIRPKDITHKARRRWLTEPIQLKGE